MNTADEKWIMCPICGAKTRARLLPDTVLRNFPLFCPKCRQESIMHHQRAELSCDKNKSSARRKDAVLTTK